MRRFSICALMAILLPCVSLRAGDRIDTLMLRIMSFNVRTVTKADSGALSWDNRKTAVTKIINDYLPAVIGTQESRSKQRADIMAACPRYAAIEVPGTGTGKGGNEVLMYLKDKVELLDCEFFFLSDTPDVPSPSWGESNSKWWRASIAGLFRDRKTGARFCVLNTHMPLGTKPSDQEGRRKAAELNIRRVFRLAGDASVPVFVLGDMNASHADSDPRRESLQPYYDALIPAREAAVITDHIVSFNSFGKGDNRMLDHIFVKNAEPKEFHTVTDSLPGIPYASDHYPVYVDAVIAVPALSPQSLKIHYCGESRDYAPMKGCIHAVGEDMYLSAEDFVEKYYEPLRARNPKYITRDSIGVDDSGRHTMWCYTFTPRRYKKTVYLQAGVHGRNEFESYFGAAMMMHLITDARKGHDPHLKYLRKNVRFILVPLVNVSDPSERVSPPRNSSKININRDWYDERTAEIRNIKALLSKYAKGEIDFAFDMHTDPEGMPGWGAYLLPWAEDMPENISDKMLAVADELYDRNIKGKVLYKGKDLYKSFRGPNTEYPSSSKEWRKNGASGNYKKGSTWKACTSGIWKTFGIPGACLEHGSRKFGPKGSVEEMTRAVELYLNHIYVQVK